MEDNELIKLAAKAAGIDVSDCKQMDDGTYVSRIPKTKNWNPLTDDGDAQRLAVRLNMYVWTIGDTDTSMANDIQEKHIGQDRYAATRRAIVRAAAEIGKTI